MSQSSDLFFSWIAYADDILANSGQPLSFPDWLASESSELNQQQIIDNLLLDRSDSRLSYSSFVVPPDLFSEFEPALPLPYTESSQDGSYSYLPQDTFLFYLSGLSSSLFPVASYSYARVVLYDSNNNSIPQYLPFIYYQNSPTPFLASLEFTSITEQNISSIPDDNYSYTTPVLLSDNSYYGFCASINLTVISVASEFDICGCVEGGLSVADCQDLINILTSIKDELVSLNTKYETVTDQLTNIATSNSQQAELLNLRLPHRDFSANSMRDLQQGIGLAASTISQRIGLVAHSIGGFAVPSSNVPDPPLTDLGLNQDTPPSGSSGSGGGGEPSN
jgi:hypothetical protein